MINTAAVVHVGCSGEVRAYVISDAQRDVTIHTHPVQKQHWVYTVLYYAVSTRTDLIEIV